MPDSFNVSISKYIDHIHLIIEINNDNEKRAIRESPLQYHRSVIDTNVIRWEKIVFIITKGRSEIYCYLCCPLEHTP